MNIEQLDTGEVEAVSGGIPLVVAGVIALYGTEIAYGAGVVAGAAVTLWAVFDD